MCSLWGLAQSSIITPESLKAARQNITRYCFHVGGYLDDSSWVMVGASLAGAALCSLQPVHPTAETSVACMAQQEGSSCQTDSQGHQEETLSRTGQPQLCTADPQACSCQMMHNVAEAAAPWQVDSDG